MRTELAGTARSSSTGEHVATPLCQRTDRRPRSDASPRGAGNSLRGRSGGAGIVSSPDSRPTARSGSRPGNTASGRPRWGSEPTTTWRRVDTCSRRPAGASGPATNSGEDAGAATGRPAKTMRCPLSAAATGFPAQRGHGRVPHRPSTVVSGTDQESRRSRDDRSRRHLGSGSRTGHRDRPRRGCCPEVPRPSRRRG